jgi:prephenate dehydrogenase
MSIDFDSLMEAPTFDAVTIIGLGLIGGSFASLLKERYGDKIHITGVDIHEATRHHALKAYLVDSSIPELPKSFTGKHLIVLATHLTSNLGLLSDVANRISQDEQHVLVTDIGSCKREITELGARLLPQQFIAGHPMAGREKSGIQHASSLLFYKRKFLLTPHQHFSNTPLQEAFTLFLEQIGMVPILMTPEFHDEAMAYMSHLPQLYAIVLTNLLARHKPGQILPLQGGGIDDQLRLAASPAAMWTPIYQANADNMAHVMDEMILTLQEMRENLKNPVAMAQWFETSNTIHQAYEQVKREAQATVASNITLL